LSNHQILMNVFNVDGLLNQNFNARAVLPCLKGQAVVLDAFDEQYCTDMFLYTDASLVTRAVIAGYLKNNALEVDNSLLVQYVISGTNLDRNQRVPGLDIYFGGYDHDPVGVCVGNLPSQAMTIGRQSMGRIIIAGLCMQTINSGLLQAYTQEGLLDQSFGQGGYVIDTDITGFTGIYTTAIDAQDRIIFGYADGQGGLKIACLLPDGSGLDQTFNAGQTPGYYDVESSDLQAPDNFKLVLDQQGNIFMIASMQPISGEPYLLITLLNSSGNLTAQHVFSSNLFDSLDNFTITQLLVTENISTISGQFEEYVVLIGYDQIDTTENQIMIASFYTTYDGLDYSFVKNQNFNTGSTPGYIKYQVATYPVQQTHHAILHPDGRLIVAGLVTNIIG